MSNIKNNMLGGGGGSVTIVTSVGDPGLDTQVPSEKAVRDALDITVASEVTGPVTTTENKIPQWSSTSKDLKDGLVLTTSVADPGVDTQVPSEKAIRTALNAKAASSHTHAESEVTNLTTDLGNKAAAPSSTTENKIPQWDSTTKLLKDGLTITTSVANPGVDTNIPTEKAVRTSLGLTSAVKTAGYTILDTDSLLTILISCSSADITIILPSAITKRKLKFVKSDNTSYRGIITRAGSDTIGLVSTYMELVTQNQSVNIESDGVSNWYY